MQALSPSYNLQHHEPLTEKEVMQLGWLFEELIQTNGDRQKFLYKAFDIVVYLRLLNEYIAWECDLSEVINTMERLNHWFQGVLQMSEDPMLKQHAKQLKDEIENHRDPSSELFIKMAEEVVAQEKEGIKHEAATKLLKTFEVLKKTVAELRQKKQVFPEGYKDFVLSLKAFGLAYKNYKSVSGAFSQALCLQIFAPAGQIVPLSVPPLED